MANSADGARPLFIFLITCVCLFLMGALFTQETIDEDADVIVPLVAAEDAPERRAAVVKHVEVKDPVKTRRKRRRTCHKAGRNGAVQCYADFIFAGVSKCGTTSMSNYLRQHPRLRAFRDEGEGEDKMFDKPRFGGEQYYWEVAPMLPPGHDELVFHYDPQYTYMELALPRIYDFFPRHGADLKFLIMLRDPVTRTKSSYYHRLKAGHADEDAHATFEDDLMSQYDAFPRYKHCFESDKVTEECTEGKTQVVFDIGKSLYFAQFRRFFKYFDEDQVMVITLEQFQADKVGVFEKALNWFEVEMLGKHGFRSETKVDKIVNEVKNRKPTPGMEPKTIRSMQQFFEPYNERLYEMLEVEPFWDYDTEPFY